MSLSRMATPPHRRLPSLSELTPGQALALDAEVLRAKQRHREQEVDQLLRRAKREKAGIEAVMVDLLAKLYIEGPGG